MSAINCSSNPILQKKGFFRKFNSTFDILNDIEILNLRTDFVKILKCHSHSAGVVDFFITLFFSHTIGFKK